MIKQVQAQL